MSATETNGRARAPRALAAVKPTGLMDALLAVQLAAPRLQKDASAEIVSQRGKYSYRYLTLDSLMDAIVPVLGSHQLVWMTLPTRDDQGDPALTYRLTHIPSGEAIEDTMPLMITKDDPQGQGSAISYARRYSLMAVLGLTAGDDDDGGGGGGQAEQPAQGPGQPAAAAAKRSDRPCSAKQRTMLRARANAAGLEPTAYANLILEATGESAREWADEEAAARWLGRALDRLPARHVDAVLERIGRS